MISSAYAQTAYWINYLSNAVNDKEMVPAAPQPVAAAHP